MWSRRQKLNQRSKAFPSWTLQTLVLLLFLWVKSLCQIKEFNPNSHNISDSVAPTGGLRAHPPRNHLRRFIWPLIAFDYLLVGIIRDCMQDVRLRFLILIDWKDFITKSVCHRQSRGCHFSWLTPFEGATGCPKKSVPQNPKRKASFTKTYCQGLKVIVFGKSNRPRGPRPVEMINFNKKYSSKESDTKGC